MMDARRFVERNRKAWERLESLLERSSTRGLGSLSPEELRELGVLHRQAAADLSSARTLYPGSKIVAYLNRLALRSHNAVYRVPRRRLWAAIREFFVSIPPTVRRRRGALAASSLIFFVGVMFGAIGTTLDDNVGRMIVGDALPDGLDEGRYWIEELTEAMPKSAISGFILTNNLWVTLRVFIFGITGLITAFDLLRNGLLLGSVLAFGGRYGILTRLLHFITGHGVIEISAVLLSGAGGFCLFDGWLHPGDRTRLQGLQVGARDGVRIAAAALPALLIAAPVEGLISTTESIPGSMRVALGIALGVVYWLWIAVGGRTSGATNVPAA